MLGKAELLPILIGNQCMLRCAEFMEVENDESHGLLRALLPSGCFYLDFLLIFLLSALSSFTS